MEPGSSTSPQPLPGHLPELQLLFQTTFSLASTLLLQRIFVCLTARGRTQTMTFKNRIQPRVIAEGEYCAHPTSILHVRGQLWWVLLLPPQAVRLPGSLRESGPTCALKANLNSPVTRNLSKKEKHIKSEKGNEHQCGGSQVTIRIADDHFKIVFQAVGGGGRPKTKELRDFQSGPGKTSSVVFNL